MLGRLLVLALGVGLFASVSCTDDSEPIPFDLDCNGAVAIAQRHGDDPSGLVRCADGFIHRTESVACEPRRQGACATDTGCEGDGRCMDDPDGGRSCAYFGCLTDADCEPGSICMCAELDGDELNEPRCMPAGCATDADCGDGLCGMEIDQSGCSGTSYRFACLTEDSECRTQCPRIRCDRRDGGGGGTPPCGVGSGDWICKDGVICGDPVNCG